MADTGIATLVSPRSSMTGNYELHLHQNPHNAASSQVGTSQTHASAGNCVSYDTLTAFLQERAKSPSEDRVYLPNGESIPVRDAAQQAVDYFKQNPATATLAREFLSNASCNDIAQLVQGIPAGFRDLEIAQGVNELRSTIPKLTTQINETYSNVHNDLVNFQNTIAMSSVILATALLIGVGSYVAMRGFRRTGRAGER